MNNTKTTETIYFIGGLFGGSLIQLLIKNGYIWKSFDVIHFIPAGVSGLTATILIAQKILTSEINRSSFLYGSFIFSFGWCLGVSWFFKN